MDGPGTAVVGEFGPDGGLGRGLGTRWPEGRGEAGKAPERLEPSVGELKSTAINSVTHVVELLAARRT